MPSMTDQPVPETVLREIWAIRPVYNGMTNVELAKRYGDRVYHVPGDTWYLRMDQDVTETPETRKGTHHVSCLYRSSAGH